MLSFSNLGAILGLNLVGMFSPGPDVFLVLRTATRSRVHAFAAIAGILTSLLFWVSLSLTGGAILLGRHPQLLSYIQLLGAGWLLFMAYGLFRSGRQQLYAASVPQDPHAHAQEVLGSWGAVYRQGLFTNLSNPKAVLYFAAILVPLFPVGAPWWVVLVYLLVIVGEAFLGFGALALFVSTDTVRRRLLRAGPWIDLFAAFVFSVFAVLLLVEASQVLLF